MSKSHTFLKYTRLIHLYLGVFITPALIFFAFTGALQTFSLHETTRGSSYKPPAWIVTLGQLHKKQTTVVPVRKLPPPEKAATPADKSQRGSGAPAQPTPAVPKPHTLPLKIFFLLVSIGLFTSTISGLYLSYKYIRNRCLVTAVLVAGTVIPIILPFV
ncbi:MAG TPA: PepSY domain-containing protein [Edaphobacter sp.]